MLGEPIHCPTQSTVLSCFSFETDMVYWCFQNCDINLAEGLAYNGHFCILILYMIYIARSVHGIKEAGLDKVIIHDHVAAFNFIHT